MSAVAIASPDVEPAPAFRSGRVIDIAFTPMVEDRKVDRAMLFGPTLRVAVSEVLRGVKRPPSEVIAEKLDGGRVGLCERREGWSPCFAVIRSGLSAEELNLGLEKLAQEGFRP